MNISHNCFQIIILFLSVFMFTTTMYPNYGNVKHTFVHSNNHSYQTYSRDVKEPKSHHSNDSSHGSTWGNSYFNSPSSHKPHFKSYNAQDFQHHFTARGYTEKEILSQRCLYMFDEFVKFAQTYSSYKCTIQQLHAELKNLNIVQKAYYIAKGTYCRGLQKRIHFLYDQLETLKTTQQNNNSPSLLGETPTYKEPVWRDHSIETFHQQHTEYKALDSTYRTYVPSLSNAIRKRQDAYKTMTSADYALRYASKSYDMHNNVKQLLHKHGHDTTHFTQSYGHQLHHAIHQESLDILKQIDCLSPNSVLYDHQEALIDFTVAMVDYNHEGLTDKAMNIGDLCWTLLDYGQAIAEGVALGIYSAVEDILTNPIEATICIVAGKQVLAYQLCKVTYNVADIGLTAITNFDHATEKWNKYAEPLNNIIDAINKKEITLRDAIKGGTALVVGWKAQSKLLGGLGKFCTTIKQKATRFAQNNVSSFKIQEYLATPEGYLLRSVAKTSCDASCPNQYDHLKQWLRIKEFTSVIKTSQHGIERLIERDFTPKDVEIVMKSPSFIKMQKDGALAYVKQIGEKFNVIIFNEHTEEVITALKNTNQKKLAQMGRNYGWK